MVSVRVFGSRRDVIGMDLGQAIAGNRKRKAENHDNERLSKRLSLLNLGSFYAPLNLKVHRF